MSNRRPSLRALFLVVVWALGSSLGGVTAIEAQGDELLYLTNTSVTDEFGELITELFLVEIDEASGTATAEKLTEFAVEQVDAMACAPDDRTCYFIDRFDMPRWPDGGMMSKYDTISEEFAEIGDVVDDQGELVPGVVLAGHSPGPDGMLYIASRTNDTLYTVDVETGQTTEIGRIVVEGTEQNLDLGGADLVFTADSRMYLWTNAAVLPEAPQGLWEIRLPVGDDDPTALYLGTGTDGMDPESNFFTGLAIRDNGLGNIVGSNRFDELHEQALDGSDIDIYSMMLGDDPLMHFSGDMHHSFDCVLNVRIDRNVYRPGDELALDVQLIHNRPIRVDTGFTVAIRDANGTVIQARSTPAQEIRWGDQLDFPLKLRVPERARPGRYTVSVGVGEMRQGDLLKEFDFEIAR